MRYRRDPPPFALVDPAVVARFPCAFGWSRSLSDKRRFRRDCCALCAVTDAVPVPVLVPVEVAAVDPSRDLALIDGEADAVVVSLEMRRLRG